MPIIHQPTVPQSALLDRISYLAQHVAGAASPSAALLAELRALCTGPCLDEGFGR